MSNDSAPSHTRLRIAGSLAAMALLSACAGKPQISAQQESTQYLTRASRNYKPPGPASDPWGPYISEAATKFDVPDRWIREVMRQESGGRLYGRNGDLITSGAGAMGLMQVMPGTYDELKARYSELGSDPFDPRNNILAGTAYIREMYDIYGSPGFLAAYNAGPGRLDDYLTRSRTLPEETRRYVASIGPKIAGAFPSTRSPGEQYAMNALPMQIPDGPRYGSRVMPAAEPTRYSPAVAIALNAPIDSTAAYTPPAYVAPAYAPPIRLTPPAPAPIVQMAALPEPPLPEPRAMDVAQAESRGGIITLSPPTQMAQVMQLPEPPLPEPPRAATARSESPRLMPFEPVRGYVRPPEPARQFAALTPVAPPRPPAFNLVSRANAAPVAVHRGGFTSGNWAVQVGAFENANLASAATAAARDSARDVLGNARPAVSTVRQPRGTLYRARLVGLSHDSAAHACEKLARSRTNCMIVSPDAQS